MSEFAFQFPLLCVDVGGTNARFALTAEPAGASSPPIHLKTGDHAGLAEAIHAALPQLPQRPRSVIACGAGPVVGRSLKLTNAPWTIDGPEVARRVGLSQGLLLNDFEAQALSLPVIREEWARRIGPVGFGASGPQVILGPGTGLGIGALVLAGGRYTSLASEACHVDFGAVTAEEQAIWPHLERAYGRVTTESVLSGAGLARVHAARIVSLARPRPALAAPAIVAAAEADRSSDEAESLRLFWRIVGRFAGDMAVTFVAGGGVTLAGGVLPRIAEFLDEATFRARFEAKAPVDRLARSIPTRLLTQADSVLAGMAAIGGSPDRYAIDFSARAWV